MPPCWAASKYIISYLKNDKGKRWQQYKCLLKNSASDDNERLGLANEACSGGKL
jgi:hypothetical protein